MAYVVGCFSYAAPVIGTYAAVALLGAGSLLVGQALCVLLRGRPAPYGGAIGLAALVVVAGAAIRLPGDATTSAVICGLLCAVSAVVLVRANAWRPSGISVAVGAVTLAGSSLPFLANGRVGLLGVSFNNDTSVHLRWAEGLRDAAVRHLAPAPDSYPLGPHSLVATVSQATGTDLDLVFSALLVLIPVLTALAALSALRSAPVAGRLIGAPLAGLAYLAAAYLGEGAFKETIVGCFVLAFAVALDDVGRPGARAREAALLAVPIAGTLYAFSYAGIAWPAGTLGIWLVLELGSRLGDGRRAVWARVRTLAVPIGLGGAVAAVLILPELQHLLAFLRSSTSAGTGGGGGGTGAGGIPTTDLGNLVGPLPIWEALGVWLGPDFRVMPPRGPLNTGFWSAIATAATVFGACGLLARRRFALPAALAACTLIYWRSHTSADSPYVTAKALAIAAPIAMATAGAGLWHPIEARPGLGGVRLARALLLTAFTVTAAWSSFTVLRGAQVAPRATQDELAALRPLLHGRPTLFLGDDDYYAWKLRGVPAGQPSYASPIQVDLRPEKPWTYPQPFDFDSVTAATLDRVDYVITPRSPVVSEPPDNFRRVRDTRLFTLWRRTGPTQERSTLPGEPGGPGAILDCRTAAGRALARTPGIARVRPAPISISGPPGALPAGGSFTLPLDLPPGRWDLSMPYLGPQPVTVATSGLRARLPAYLDRPGPVFQLGTITVPQGGPTPTATLRIDDPAPPGLRSPMHVAYAGNILATPAGARAVTVPLARACGRYVDWYRTA